VPAAIHAVEDEHDTLVRTLLSAPIGLGDGWIDQPAPFQRSTSVSVRPAAV
jgi:hypothetical protein